MNKALSAGAVLLLIVAAAWAWLGGWPSDRTDGEAPPPLAAPAADPLERGRELVRLGDCRACHTTRGGASYAGGRAIDTPFGLFYSPNITPDADTGIGRWSADDFWRALHEGRAPDGRPLYPSFPYTNYTRISRADADAMYAYLRSLAPVTQRNREHELRFPFNQRSLLHGWRLLFFRPGVYQPDVRQSAEWNRGAYLVQGLGHCSACHEARNALGAIRSRDNPSGGLVLNWYAPTLSAPAEAGVQDWSVDDIVALLQTGRTAHASTLGPMAEVVFESLQHADPAELRAMAVYLKSLPPREPVGKRRALSATRIDSAARQQRHGEQLYAEHCASCHGSQGEGLPPAAPALAANRALTMDSAVNPIRIVLFGGYAPGTAGNPRPFGMPPFHQRLSDEDVAAVLTYIRTAWGNQAPPVSSADVARDRGGPLW